MEYFFVLQQTLFFRGQGDDKKNPLFFFAVYPAGTCTILGTGRDKIRHVRHGSNVRSQVTDKQTHTIPPAAYSVVTATAPVKRLHHNNRFFPSLNHARRHVLPCHLPLGQYPDMGSKFIAFAAGKTKKYSEIRGCCLSIKML